MIVLGIETSCDETAAALVTDRGEILANAIFSQIDDHKAYGGVVPEVAARAHLDAIDHIVSEAMDAAGLGFSDIDAVAATGGPGLIGGVLVGVMTAKAIATVHDKPFYAVNHLEGHALSPRLGEKAEGRDLEFPYLLLLVSGGHCQLLAVLGPGQYKRLGTTIDDALGEAFDKTAKMLGLGYPGGPAVEAAALAGDENRFDLPRPLKGRKDCHFSFSGLKTAIRQTVDKLPPGKLSDDDIADLCASFQLAAGDVLVDRCKNAIKQFEEILGAPKALVVAGGVAANKVLRGRLADLAKGYGLPMIAPPMALCTDNAAMIAWAALENIALEGTRPTPLDFKPRPRWPLDPDPEPVKGAGIKAGY